MKKVDLNSLPAWSPWPARLFGLVPWVISARNISKIDEEYDKDKYARCLDYFASTSGQVMPEDVRQFEFGLDPDERICMSSYDELYELSLSEARVQHQRLLLDTLHFETQRRRTIVELGCGYGYNLWVAKQRFNTQCFIGGEYSSNAIQLASQLYKHETNIEVRYFNFADQDTYNLLKSANPPVVIFTVHAIEQLPCSSLVFDALLNYRENISSVFHFEPAYQLYGQSLLGMMRRRYMEINDYNRDLVAQLRQHSYIRINNIRSNVLGLNPLNPTSVIHWEFAK